MKRSEGERGREGAKRDYVFGLAAPESMARQGCARLDGTARPTPESMVW